MVSHPSEGLIYIVSMLINLMVSRERDVPEAERRCSVPLTSPSADYGKSRGNWNNIPALLYLPAASPPTQNHVVLQPAGCEAR
jgi:hypothetical protein